MPIFLIMLEEGIKRGRQTAYNTSKPTINYFIHCFFWQVSVVATKFRQRNTANLPQLGRVSMCRAYPVFVYWLESIALD